jgi:hypothetical protein
MELPRSNDGKLLHFKILSISALASASASSGVMRARRGLAGAAAPALVSLDASPVELAAPDADGEGVTVVATAVEGPLPFLLPLVSSFRPVASVLFAKSNPAAPPTTAPPSKPDTAAA